MNNIIKFCGCILLMLSVISCNKEEDVQEENATLLPEYAQGAKASAGHNRAKLSFAYNKDIQEYKVYWNKREQSKTIDLSKPSRDSIHTIIEGLTEGSHKFEIVSYGAQGDSSTVVVSSKVYGTKYISTLKNREVKNMTFMAGEDAYIDWGIASKDEVALHVTYTDTEGNTHLVKMNKQDIYSPLPDYKENTSIKFVSLHVPEPGSIDTLFREANIIPQITKEIPTSVYTRYVAPISRGTGDGGRAVNAADFLDDAFWQGIQTLLAQGSVTVKFVVGDYARAYSEKSFIIDKMGNAQNRLLLEGSGTGTVFTALTGMGNKTVMMQIRDTQNIVVKNFNFKGDGNVQYVLRILGTAGRPGLAKNITIEDCTWSDMRGVVYGATGAHYTAEHVTYRRCKFYRIGINHASHMIYNAYGATHVRIVDSHLEDCTGDFVRFRDKCDYGVVNNTTFFRNLNFPTNANFQFISMPLFNDVNPGDEHFATNYSFTSNRFTNAPYAFTFYHDGYSPTGFNHLLTAAQGTTMTSGTVAAKKALLKTNLGIDTDKVRLHGNTYANVTGRFAFGSATAYGAVSKGWEGTVNITNLFNENNAVEFAWEK
ncbi:DUF4998 domain-containing protein [Sphingobacterium pedocola]|uniref:DUF4957 domain-containing protein n=1 Tax=Sphingobacterium pedocola TaxID=2082722 RepID=A0ABR9T797_9SPHI|nr:DUF4998 domain-containing protein [Sphingobacterium pedocola]MBE8721232.1 hypothetical protein [Sphingobacterium pedocola]